MPQWRPDQTFYPSPKMAMQAPQEALAYVAMLDPTRTKPDALAVVEPFVPTSTFAIQPRIPSDGLRPHQVHLDGGDASSDSYCYSG